MSIDYAWDPDENRVRTTVTGTLNPDDFIRYCESVLADPRIGAGFIETLVLDRSCTIGATFRDLLPFARLWRRYLEKGVQGTIVLARSDSTYGVFRMFEGAIASDSVDPAIVFEVVSSEEEMEARVREIRQTPPTGSG